MEIKRDAYLNRLIVIITEEATSMSTKPNDESSLSHTTWNCKCYIVFIFDNIIISLSLLYFSPFFGLYILVVESLL